MKNFKKSCFDVVFAILFESGFSADMVVGDLKRLVSDSIRCSLLERKETKYEQESGLPAAEFSFSYVDVNDEKKTLTGTINKLKRNKNLKLKSEFEILLKQSFVAARDCVKDVKEASEFQAQQQKLSLRKYNTTIINNKYVVGLLFLNRFVSVVNMAVDKKFLLPEMILGWLEKIYKKSIVVHEAIENEKRETKKIQKMPEIQVLQQINEITCGRCKNVVHFLELLEAGDDLNFEDEREISMLRAKFNVKQLESTENAYPFLLFFVKKAKLMTRDVDYREMYESFLRQVEQGKSLSDKQLSIVRKKFIAYAKFFEALPKIEQMTSAQLLEMLKRGVADTKEVFAINEVLKSRGIDSDKLLTLNLKTYSGVI